MLQRIVCAFMIVMSITSTAAAAQAQAVKKCCSARPLLKKFGPGPNGKPVTVDVGQCAGSCTSSQFYWDSKPIGGDDRYTGQEPSSPSPLFLASSYLTGRPLNLFFDSTPIPIDRIFGHTIKLPFNCRDVTRIKLKFCLNASRSSLTTTDHIAIWDPQPGNDLALWAPRLTTLYGQWNPNDNGCLEQTFSAGDLTGVVEYVNTYRELNVGVDDDTGVNYLQLQVWYDRLPKVCQPAKTTKVKVALATGVQTVDKILECECSTSKVGPCSRKPKPKLEVFFHNSVFEQTVDVGRCVGHCSFVFVPWWPAEKSYDVVVLATDPTNATRKINQTILAPQRDLKCQPYRTKEVTIRGPNGPICVEMIDECRCNDNCYKMAHFQEFVEVIRLNNQLTAERRRIFNIGKCVGACSNDGRDDGVMYLDDDCPFKCIPTRYINHKPFLLRDGTFKTVSEISDCDCSQVGR